MRRVAVVQPVEQMTVGQWRRHFEKAEIVAVLSLEHEHLLGALVTQLGDRSLIAATRPIGEALKVVVEELVVESVSRDDVVQLVEPYAFSAELGHAVLDFLDEDSHIDLLPILARAARPVGFQIPADDS